MRLPFHSNYPITNPPLIDGTRRIISISNGQIGQIINNEAVFDYDQYLDLNNYPGGYGNGAGAGYHGGQSAGFAGGAAGRGEFAGFGAGVGQNGGFGGNQGLGAAGAAGVGHNGGQSSFSALNGAKSEFNAFGGNSQENAVNGFENSGAAGVNNGGFGGHGASGSGLQSGLGQNGGFSQTGSKTEFGVGQNGGFGAHGQNFGAGNGAGSANNRHAAAASAASTANITASLHNASLNSLNTLPVNDSALNSAVNSGNSGNASTNSNLNPNANLSNSGLNSASHNLNHHNSHLHPDISDEFQQNYLYPSFPRLNLLPLKQEKSNADDINSVAGVPPPNHQLIYNDEVIYNPNNGPIPGTAAWKKERLLERNRIAASKCRQRKKQAHLKLQDNINKFEKEIQSKNDSVENLLKVIRFYNKNLQSYFNGDANALQELEKYIDVNDLENLENWAESELSNY